MNETARHPDDFAGAFEAAFAALQVRIETACIAEAAWPARVAAGIRAAFAWALAGGKGGFARYERMVSYVAELLAPGRAESDHGERLPEITERAMASGVAMLVAQRLTMGRESELPALAGEAIQFVLTPYLGTAGARHAAAD
jgi:hypothetical protein